MNRVNSSVSNIGWRLRLANGDQTGQASTEYALVLLGAAAVALLVTGWATHTDKIRHLLDAVLDQVLRRAR